MIRKSLTITQSNYLLGGGIHIGTELGEGGDFTELGQIQLHGTRNLLHGLHLGGGTDTGDGQTDVDGWADTLQVASKDQFQNLADYLQEKFVLQEDLTVSDRDDVGWDVGGDITGLGLNDWEGSQGTGAEVVRDLGGTLQETGVEVENVTGVGLK